MKYFVRLLVSILFILNCDSNNKSLVYWTPVNLHTGGEIEIYYNSINPEARFSSGQNIKLILEFIFTDSTDVKVESMENKNEAYRKKIKIPDSAKLLCFKFEADNGITEDNDGRGWNIQINGTEGKPQKDWNYFLGKIWDGRLRPAAKADLGRALEFYKTELEKFPENFKVWHAIWQCQMNQEKAVGDFSQNISNQLDSLLSRNSDNPDVIKLAFDTYRTLVPNRPKAEYYASRYLAENPGNANTAKIAWFLIFLNEDNSGEVVVKQLNDFLLKYPEFADRILVYKNLSNYYMRLRQNAELFQTLNEIIKIDPTDFSNYVTCARHQTFEGQYKEAESYINLAFEKCTLDNFQLREPWMDGFERQIQYNIDLASIHSALAFLNFQMDDYEESIKNRKKAIELGSPFPAFEWEYIGLAYYKMRKIESAKHAFAAALLKNPTQDGAIQGLFQIFSEDNKKTEKNFDSFVQMILMNHQKSFAKPTGDFLARDLNDINSTLSSQKNNIVVLYFGATILWEKSDILDRLNLLARKYQNRKDIKFWVLSIESKKKVSQFLADKIYNLSIFYGSDEAKEKMQIQGFPTYIIIDREGIEQFRQVGESLDIEKILEAKINKLTEKITS